MPFVVSEVGPDFAQIRGGLSLDAVDQPTSASGQGDKPRPAVVGVGAALDPAIVFEARNHACEFRRGETRHLGEFLHAQRTGRVFEGVESEKLSQRDPLIARHREMLGIGESPDPVYQSQHLSIVVLLLHSVNYVDSIHTVKYILQEIRPHFQSVFIYQLVVIVSMAPQAGVASGLGPRSATPALLAPLGIRGQYPYLDLEPKRTLNFLSPPCGSYFMRSTECSDTTQP